MDQTQLTRVNRTLKCIHINNHSLSEIILAKNVPLTLVADPPASKLCYIIHGVEKGPRSGARGSAIKWKVYHTSVDDINVEIIEKN